MSTYMDVIIVKQMILIIIVIIFIQKLIKKDKKNYDQNKQYVNRSMKMR